MPIPGFPDGKAREEERIARIAAARKRERSISPPPARSPKKAPKLELEERTVNMETGAKLKLFAEGVQKDQVSDGASRERRSTGRELAVAAI